MEKNAIISHTYENHTTPAQAGFSHLGQAASISLTSAA